jgi:hypothetical protein
MAQKDKGRRGVYSGVHVKHSPSGAARTLAVAAVEADEPGAWEQAPRKPTGSIGPQLLSLRSVATACEKAARLYPLEQLHFLFASASPAFY